MKCLKKILKDQFLHLEEDDSSDVFLKYKGMYFHLSDFEIMDGPKPWHGAHAAHAFMAYVIEVSRDHEEYRIGILTT